MKKVLIPTKLDGIAQELLEAHGYAVVADAHTSLDELVGSHSDAAALIVRSNKITAEVIDALPNLELIVRAGAGYNTIDIRYARKRKVDVMNTPGANSNAVAEEVVALVLAHYRHILQGDRTTREGLWQKKELMGRELGGKTVGVVGLGNIGQLVVRRMSGFECNFLGYDPFITPARAEELGVTLASLDEIFQQADIVTLHIPENEETKGMVNQSFLDQMKPGAVLVNCARAGVINEDDLRAARQARTIAFLNDVYPEDKPGQKSVSDVADIMLPHLGANTVEANHHAARRAAEQLIAYYERGVTRYVVNRGVPEGLDVAYQELAYQIGAFARAYLGGAGNISRIECSFYGDLHEYGKWLLPPVVAGVATTLDKSLDDDEAETFLKEMGVGYEIREVDMRKSYGESMTIDLFEGDKAIQRVSIRGTVTEGNPMISRINDFDKLYFPAVGHTLVVIYDDRPGVLAEITAAMAEEHVNIEDIRAPHDERTKKSIAIVKANRSVSDRVLGRIRARVNPEVAFATSIND